MEVSGKLHALAALPLGKSPWYPLDRKLGGSRAYNFKLFLRVRKVVAQREENRLR